MTDNWEDIRQAAADREAREKWWAKWKPRFALFGYALVVVLAVTSLGRHP